MKYEFKIYIMGYGISVSANVLLARQMQGHNKK